jgi:hypothetical protein
MFSKRESNLSQATVRVTPKFWMYVRMPLVILICAFASPLWLQAQEDPCDAPILSPPPPVGPNKPVCPAPTPDNLADGTKSALSCAWIENPPHPDGTDHVLEAFRLLTSSQLVFSKINQKVLVELRAASPENQDLFRAALGNPDKYGAPTVQGMPGIVDILSKANTRGKVAAKDEIDYHHQLFSCSKYIIDQLFTKDVGKLALVGINDAFRQENNYVAMYELLNVVWEQNGAAYDPDHLEKLRAAFDISVDDLGKQVAAKITPTGK